MKYSCPSDHPSFYDPSYDEMPDNPGEWEKKMLKSVSGSFEDFNSCMEHGDRAEAAEHLNRIAELLDVPFSKDIFKKEGL